MNLHRIDKVAEWENIPSEQRNFWQRRAAASNGLVTPGNAISFLGFAITMWGLIDINKNKTSSGIKKIAVGRTMDILDGFVADKTKTKSPLGEGVDATLDKVSALLALPILAKKELIPSSTAIKFIIPHLANTAITALSKHKEVEIHPSFEGKLTTAGQWCSVGLYGLGKLANENGNEKQENIYKLGADLLDNISTQLAVKTISGYIDDYCSGLSTQLNIEKNIDT